MTDDVKIIGRLPGFYGWYALAGTMIAAFISGGALINAFGVLLPVICEKFHWGRAVVAGILSVGMISFGLPSPIYGLLVNRLGPKSCIILGNFLAALGFAAVYLVNEIWQFYLLYILIGAGAGLGGVIAGTTVVNNWFSRMRSLAFGLLLSCAGLGGFVFPPLVAALVSSVGLQKTYLVIAALVFVGPVILGGVILIKNRPEDMDQIFDIKILRPCDERDESISYASEDQHLFGLAYFLRKPTVWLIAAFVTSYSFAVGTMFTHQVAYLRDIGFNAMLAATTMSSLAVSGIIGSIVFGTLAMRFNIRYLASVAFLFHFIGLLILMTTEEIAFIYFYTFIMGLGNGSLSAAMPTFVGTYYPRKYYSRIIGFILPFNLVGQSIAAATVGAIYDFSHSYRLAFSILIVCALMGMICAFMARKPEWIK
jgi:MFS family permease